MTHPTERPLTAVQGDFASLFREHYPQVYRYVRYRIDDDATAEDLTAEVFERAYRARASFDPSRAAFSTWIGQIAHNHLTNYLISKQRRQERETNLSEAETLPASDPLPESQVIAREAVRRLMDCLKLLSDRDRQIISLRFGANVRNKAIADLLGMKEHSVSVVILRALDRLRGCQEQI
ncbi:MAG: RNA polymerase sigma factor [Aggregatilineales bacterium]